MSRHLRAVGGGVYEGPEPDPDDPGPAPDAVPLCPICPADKPHRVVRNDGKAPGWLCEGCGFLLTPNVGGDNNARRDLWAEETRGA